MPKPEHQDQETPGSSNLSTIALEQGSRFYHIKRKCNHVLGSNMISSEHSELIEKIYECSSKINCESVEYSFQALDELSEKTATETSNTNSELNQTLAEPKFLNHVVYCWSQSEDVPSHLHAEALFRKLQNYRLNGLRTDIHTYNILINAIEDRISDISQAPSLINAIIHYLESEFKKDETMCPTVVTFTSIIKVLSRCSLPEAPDHAEKCLTKMIEYNKSGKIDKPPCQSLYTLVLKAWSNSGLATAGENAEDLLHRMQNSDVPGIFPDTIAFSVVLNIWGKQEKAWAANRAFAILKHMEKRFKSDNTNAKPNAYCYATVINAYGRIGKAVEAEQVLERFIKEYEASEDPDMRPDSVAFTSTINAWSKRGGYEGAIRAEALLEKMHSLFITTGNKMLEPHTFPFTSVLHAWARSREKMAARRAETILMRMQELHESGFENVKPNRISYATVIDCWAKSTEHGAAERAEALLNSLMSLYEQSGDIDLRPNSVTFSSVMDAWTKSRERNYIVRIEDLLSKMEQMYAAGAHYAKPNAISYTIVLTAHATDPKANNETVEKSFAIFNKMKKLERAGDSDLAPSTKTYGSMIRIVANRRGQHDNAGKAKELLQEMRKRKIVVDEYSLSYTFLACSRTKGSRSQQKAAFVIARSLYRELKQTVKKPSAASYTNFILACCGNNEKLVEEAYADCCKHGHGKDARVLKAVKRAAPNVLRRC